MENDIPKIDLPQDWVIGKLSIEDIGLLNLYANYPCRLKAGIFVLCLGGEIEASINLTQLKVEPGSFITIMPGSILQIHRADGDLQIYFMGFSSDFLSQANSSKAVIDMHYIVKDNPVYKLKEKAQPLMKDYFELLLKTYEFYATKINRGITNHLFTGMLMGISSMYKDQTEDLSMLSKAELISKNFTQLVMQNYNHTRNVAWYAEKLKISNIHLCTTVKKVTGNTCAEIISHMVIMDAKSQLKSTHLSIQEISNSLNFANTSFFGKYFKRYVGMSPLAYRNNG